MLCTVQKKSYTLITGASSGIGLELAKIAAAQGHDLVLVARRRDALDSLAASLQKEHSVVAEVIALDLGQPESPTSLAAALKKRHIQIDTLINNAGFGDYGPFTESKLSTQLSMIDLNIRALVELTHRLAPDMVARGNGRIMNVASVAGFLPGPLMATYFASKAFVLSFSEALGVELAGSGVTVTCLCPGSTKTSFGENAHVSATHSTRTSRVTAAQVAAFGWKAMMSGKPVAVHGIGNRWSLFLTRFVPRGFVTKLVHSIQR